jgi:hypothetical protein
MFPYSMRRIPNCLLGMWSHRSIRLVVGSAVFPHSCRLVPGSDTDLIACAVRTFASGSARWAEFPQAAGLSR